MNTPRPHNRYSSHIRYDLYNKKRGIAALMLVMSMSLSIAGVLFALSYKNASLIQTIGDIRVGERAWSAGIYCRDKVIASVMRDSLAVPPTVPMPGSVFSLPLHTSCTVDIFSRIMCLGKNCCDPYSTLPPSLCTSTSYGEVVSAGMTGIDASRNQEVHKKLQVKMLFLNAPPYIPYILYTKE